jgi:hypothetical protein
MQTTPPQQIEPTRTPASVASPDRVDIVTRVRPSPPAPGKIARRLAAVGIRAIPSETGAYADCPFCDRFAGLIIEPGGKTWRLVCGCRPARERYDAVDLAADLVGMARR